MSRIDTCFSKAESDHRKLLITYLMSGDPSIEDSLALMHAMVAAGADIIELGMPFSDPQADGPVVQAASQRVLEAGVRLPQVFQLARSFRERDSLTPLVLMGYANPIEIAGYEAFSEQAAEAGIDGVITVDMPPEEAGSLCEAFAKRKIDPIFLLSPTTPDSRVQTVCEKGGGFIYYVSLKGVTGSSKLDAAEVADKVARIKNLSDLPVGVGFGISDAESAGNISRVADAVIVGSALVKRIEEYGRNPERMIEKVTELVSGMRSAIDNS